MSAVKRQKSWVKKLNKEELTCEQVNDVLNKKSGVLGVSGISSDFRDLLKAANEVTIEHSYLWTCLFLMLLNILAPKLPYSRVSMALFLLQVQGRIRPKFVNQSVNT